MKKIKFIITLCIIIVLTTCQQNFVYGEQLIFENINYQKSDNIRVIVEGTQIQFDVNPQIINGRTLVPMRAIFEKIGLTVNWDDSTKIAKGTSNENSITFAIGSKQATVNNQEKILDVPASIIDGRTMVPLRFLSENMGYNVVWVGDSNLILMSKKDVVEWRFGGHETIEPYREYEAMYINGEKTSNTRYISNNTEVEISTNEIKWLSKNYNIFRFSEGLAVVEYEGKYGFIDKLGNEVINLKFKYKPNNFSNGLALVQIDGKYGYIDKNGNIVIKNQYNNASDFYGDIAWVEKEGKYGFVNKYGEQVIPCIYDSVGSFREDGYIWVEKEGKYGFVNSIGVEVILCQYDMLDERLIGFSEGLCVVHNESYGGYIDINNNYVITFDNSSFAYPFINGYATVNTEDGVIYYDNNGNKILSITGGFGQPFDGDIAFVQTSNGNYYMNKSGEVIAYNVSKQIRDFNEGLACIIDFEKCGYVNSEMKLVIPIIYDVDYMNMFFNEGVVPIKSNNKYGCLDKNGNQVLPIIYDYVSSSNEGVIVVSLDGEYGCYDNKGNEIIPLGYDYVSDCYEGIVSVSKDGKSGLITILN